MTRPAGSLAGSCSLLLAGLLLAFVAMPGSVLAARPHGGGHYYAPAPDSPEIGVNLGVSPRGRRVATVRVYLECGRPFRRTLHFGGDPDAAIGRGGTFAMAGRHGRLRYRMRGRFLTPRRARLVYRFRLSVPTLEGQPSPVCGSGLVRTMLDLNGLPPYSGCASQRAVTRLRTADGRVFQQLRLIRSAGVPAGYEPYVYACSFEADRLVELGRDSDPDLLGGFRLVRQFVAYVRYYICGAGTCPYSLQAVAVRDLRDGSLVREVSTFPGAYAGVDALVLADSGAIAWSLTSAPDLSAPERSRHDVWAHDGAGERLLDSGPDLDTRSLMLSGPVASWVNGGVARSEVLR